MLVIVALLCQSVAGQATEFCFEKIIAEAMVCDVPQPALADWKMNSPYADDSYRIAKILCKPKGYQPKEST